MFDVYWFIIWILHNTSEWLPSNKSNRSAWYCLCIRCHVSVFSLLRAWRTHKKRNRNYVSDTVTRLWRGQRRNRGLIPERRKRPFCTPNPPYRLWQQHSPLFTGYFGLFLGVGRDHIGGTWGWPIPPIYYQGQEWVQPYLHSPISLYGVQRRNFCLLHYNSIYNIINLLFIGPCIILIVQ